jgi:hypothetical protein
MDRIKTIFLTLLILSYSVGLAQAQEPIEATIDATLLPEMPRRSHFTLEAVSNAGDLIEARVFFQPIGSSARISEPVQFEPAPSISLEHEWQMQLNGIPPGAQIEYFWRLTDSAGNKFDTPKQTYVALDPRFEWQTVEDEELAISWYDGEEAWGQEMFDTGKQALAQLEDGLGSDVTRQIRLVAFGDKNDFRGSFPPAQDWIGGQAFVDLGVTVQIIGEGDTGWMRTVLFHELSHLVFSQALEGALAPAPSWLDEGLAMYNEPDDLDSTNRNRNSARLVEEAAENNELLAFSQLQGNFGADRQVVGIAYAQSEMMVTYFINDCEKDGFRQLIQNLVDDMSVDGAIEAACGYNSQTLYNNWRQTQPNPPAAPSANEGSNTESSQPPTSQPPTEQDSLSSLIPILLGAGVCLISLLMIAIVFVARRLMRSQGAAQ